MDKFETEFISNKDETILLLDQTIGSVSLFRKFRMLSHSTLKYELIKFSKLKERNYIPIEFHNDQDFVLEMIKKQPNLLEFTSETCRNNKEIVNTAINKDRKTFTFASKTLKLDKELILMILEKGDKHQFSSLVPVSYTNDKDFMMQAIKKEFLLKLASETLRDDRDLVLEAVSNGINLHYASDRLKCDKEIVLKAQTSYERAFKIASPDLQLDSDIIAARYEFNKKAIGNCHDRNRILKLISTKPYLFAHVKPKFKNDKEIVLALLEKSVWKLESVSERLKDDEDVIMKAVKKDGFSIRFASERLNRNKEIAFMAMKTSECKAIQYISKDLKHDREFLLSLVQYGPVLESNSPIYLKNDRELLLESIKIRGTDIQFASDDLKQDKELIFQAVKIHAYAISFIPLQAISSTDILELVKINPHVMKFLVNYYKDKETLHLATDGVSLIYASYRLRNSKPFVLDLVRKNGCALIGRGSTLRDDDELITEAVKQNGFFTKYNSALFKLRMDLEYPELQSTLKFNNL